MPAAEDDGKTVVLQDLRDLLGQEYLRLFQALFLTKDIAGIMAGTFLKIGEVCQGAAYRCRPFSCSRAAEVAAHAFVAGETEQSNGLIQVRMAVPGLNNLMPA